VGYEGYTEDRLKIEGDRMSAADFKLFLEAALRSCRAAVKPGASLYVCHSSSWQREFQNALESAGLEIRCQIIWAKNTFAWGFGRYKFQHEPMFYCHVLGQKDPWYGNKSQSTLWEEKKPAANRIHPTAKPVELVERALVNSSKAGDIVVDLFGGSGSTLIGCERRGRQARLMEIDPKYADCIVRRWAGLYRSAGNARWRWPDLRPGQSGTDGTLNVNGIPSSKIETYSHPGRTKSSAQTGENSKALGCGGL
jgi:DNA modification methylase